MFYSRVPSVAAFILIFCVWFFWTGNNRRPCWRVGGNYRLVFLVHVPSSFVTIQCNFLNSVFWGWSVIFSILTLFCFSRYFILSHFLLYHKPPRNISVFQGTSLWPRSIVLLRPLIHTCQSPSFDLPISCGLTYRSLTWCQDFLTQGGFSLLL